MDEYNINNLNNPFVFNNRNEPVEPNATYPGGPTVPEVEAMIANAQRQNATNNFVGAYGDPSGVQGFDNRGQPTGAGTTVAGAGIQPIYANALAANNNNLPFNPIKAAKNMIQNKILNKVNAPSFMPMALTVAGAMLPKEDPMVTAAKNYYSGMYGTDDIGRIAEGDLMAGYNPVSGGGLYTLTGGRAGDPPTLGLDKAYEKRIQGIEKTLRRKYKMTDAEIADIYAGDYKGDVSSDLINRIVTLKDRQTKDRKTINRIKQKHGGNDNTINNPNVTSKVGYKKKDADRESYRGKTTPKRTASDKAGASWEKAGGI